jgi:putative ABC transport system ATP-binding protein
MALVKFKDISKVYPSSPPVHALRNVNFEINEGEFIAIVGPSGSGKSTLLNVLGLLDMPTSGRYFLDGEETQALNLGERTKLRGTKIGFVFQSFHLLQTKTALENVALTGMYTGVPRQARLMRAKQALTQVGLEERQNFLPGKLSGGQKQRVAVARAICSNPRILLCDEPTGNLDSKTAGEIEQLLHDMSDTGLTIVVVTHNEELASRCDRIIRVSDGEVADE